jgi:hypothetical protein
MPSSPNFESGTVKGEDGHDLVRKLREAHGCSPDCGACKSELDEYRVPSFRRWTKFVNSDEGTRIAIAVVEYKATFPKFSDDPLEQFLIEEAVLGRYYVDKAERMHEETVRQETHAKGHQTLADYKAQMKG